MPIALVEFEPCASPSVEPAVSAEVAQTAPHDILSLAEGSSVIKPKVLEQMKLAYRQGSIKRATSADSVPSSIELPAVSTLNVRASALSIPAAAAAEETPTYFLVPNTNPPIYVAANPKQHEQVVQDELLGVKRSRSESATTVDMTDTDSEASAKQIKSEDLDAAQGIAKSLVDWCDLYKQVDRAHRRAVKRNAAKRRSKAKAQAQEVKVEVSQQITLSPGFSAHNAQMMPLALSLPSSPSTGSIDSLSTNWLDGSADSDSGTSSAATTPVPPSDDDDDLPRFDLAVTSSAATSEDESAGLWHSPAAGPVAMLADPKQHAYASANIGNIFVGAAAPHETCF